jgi:hypothetical protein
MEPVTRRSFLVKGSAGAAGAAAAFGGGWVLSGEGGEAEPLSAAELEEAGGEMVVASVRDAAAGEVELLVGEREIVLTDKALVAQLLRATR